MLTSEYDNITPMRRKRGENGLNNNHSKTNEYDARINRVCDYIEQHLDEAMSLDNLCQLAHFSKFHFHRQFSDYTGITVFRFIQLMRLKRASYRLAFDKDEKIIDIALDAQFENPESFSRAFKNLFNQTPSQFRAEPDWPNWNARVQIQTPDNKRNKPMDIKIVDFKQTKVAVLEHRAPPDQVLDSVSKFIEWRKQSQLSPVITSRTFGIIYDNPETTPADEFRFDICGSVEHDIPENPQHIYTSDIPGGRCAVLRHNGSLKNVGESVCSIYADWLPESGEELRDYPCFFHYLNLITDVEEHELKTDIYIPLK